MGNSVHRHDQIVIFDAVTTLLVNIRKFIKFLEGVDRTGGEQPL